MITVPMGPRDVARATGVSTDTLRHYERKGLLPGVVRTAAGYRRYSAAAIERVLLIQRALVVGFSLADLKRVLGVRDRGGGPCEIVRALVGERAISSKPLGRAPLSRERAAGGVEAVDNQFVRRLLAVAILVVFASLNAIDGICCPDGCTHERESTLQQRGDHAGDGSCMLCLGGIDSADAPVLAPSGILTDRIGHPPLRSHLDALANPPDHPPRS